MIFTPASIPGISDAHLRMPFVEKGMAVGLFGGSFNPPHAGHALVAEIAMRKLKLDQLWWIVTPGNPLKDKRELAPLSDRLEKCEALIHDPRVKVTAFEAAHHIRYTADTLALIKLKDSSAEHFLKAFLQITFVDCHLPAEFLDCNRLPDMLQ